MNYQQLMAEHDAIEAAASVVVSLCDRNVPRPGDLAKGLEILADLLRRHLESEDEAIYQTILRAQGGRHADTARRMGDELVQLRSAWETYLYRWDAHHVAANWVGFVDETTDILGRIRERVAFETMVLYSLAVHLEVIAAD